LAQASKRVKRLRRIKRENTKLRKTVQILPRLMQEQVNRAYAELLPLVYALLAEQGDVAIINNETMEDIRANGSQMKYTVKAGQMDKTHTIIRLVRPALTVTPIPDEDRTLTVGTEETPTALPNPVPWTPIERGEKQMDYPEKALLEPVIQEDVVKDWEDKFQAASPAYKGFVNPVIELTPIAVPDESQ
jgi:hypothetical protein